MPVSFAHAFAVRSLPRHHGDPFNRMLVAQARMEGLTILTVNPLIQEYGVRTLDAAR